MATLLRKINLEVGRRASIIVQVQRFQNLSYTLFRDYNGESSVQLDTDSLFVDWATKLFASDVSRFVVATC